MLAPADLEILHWCAINYAFYDRSQTRCNFESLYEQVLVLFRVRVEKVFVVVLEREFERVGHCRFLIILSNGRDVTDDGNGVDRFGQVL